MSRSSTRKASKGSARVRKHRQGDEAKVDGQVPELSFEEPRPARIGDLRSRDEDREEFPSERVRTAGRTGGEVPGADVTADDVSPETLLDDLPSHTPSAEQQRVPMDTLLRDVDAEVAATGSGPDEQEIARQAPDPAPERPRRKGKGAPVGHPFRQRHRSNRR